MCPHFLVNITVEPVLSGHPWGMAKRPLDRGDHSIGVKSTLSKGDVQVIFGTLTAGHLMEGDRLIRCRLIQVRLYFNMHPCLD